MSKKYGQIVISFILFNFSLTTAYATDTSFVASISAGPSWAHGGEAQTLSLTPDIIKTYTADNSTQALSTGELFLGIQHALLTHLNGQIGLAFTATGHDTLSGDIWDNADSEFNNYTYQYKVSHTAISLKGKLLGHWNYPLMPWASASLGIGSNKAYGFNSTPTITEAAQTPNFASNTNRTLTYTLGLGVQRQLNIHWQVGAGYEFSDWGKSTLGSVEGSNQTLSLSHLYTNSLLFNVTYVF